MKYASLATDDDSDDRKGALFERSCKSKLGRRHFFFILSTLGICLFGATIFIIRKSSNGLHCLTSFNGQKAFTHQPEWESFSNERDHLWEGLLTPNGGFLVQDTEGIKHNVGISMFHQLHCLQAIRTQMQALLPNASNHASAHGGEHDVHHVGHCFDYLRQSILCHADDTLEAPAIADLVDGYVIHQCRDPEPLYTLSLKSGLLDDENGEYGISS